MHETAIASELLRVVEIEARLHRLCRVSTLKLKVGAFRMLVPELLRSAFEVVSQSSVAAGAELVIDLQPLIAYCELCHEDVAVDDYVMICPQCSAPLGRIVRGKELDLTEITGETEAELSAEQGSTP